MGRQAQALSGISLGLMQTPQIQSLYFVRESILQEFRDEAAAKDVVLQELSPLIFCSASTERLFWVLDFWRVDEVPFESISHAVKILRSRNKKWTYVGCSVFRRGQLIADGLKVAKAKKVQFPAPTETQKKPAFTLKNTTTLLVCEKPLKGNFAGGKVALEEDRVGPPSRAYLKLQEALTLANLEISDKDSVLDLGATPGGWSYVAASLGAAVTMIDRSEPDPKLFKKFKKLEYIKGDGLNPTEAFLSKATVLVSDMACEPARLLKSVSAWVNLPHLRFMVCTLKFHGISDKKVIAAFAAIPHSEIYHLWNNGHELTWVWKKAR